MNPLGELYNYSKFMVLFESNKDKPWDSWLDFVKLLVPGKQGVVGLLKTKEGGIYCVFKLSQYINNLIIHESVVMDGLSSLSSYCPHFCKSFGLVDCYRNPETVKKESPFVQKSNIPYMISDKMLLQEYIDKSNKFYNYIKSAKINDDVLFSTIKQVLLGTCMAQRRKQFTHYDLHSLNIMMKKCNKDLVFLYVLDSENQLCVPTLGHYPIIIDYGFSYINDMQDGPLWPTLEHTSSGFVSDRFDPITDPKLFLVTVSYEIKQHRDSPGSRILRKTVRNLFKPLSIEWDCGWDETEQHDAPYEILKIIKKYGNNSVLFNNHPGDCIDLIHSLIILPCDQQDSSSFDISVKTFIKEWSKIEQVITDSFYLLYILRGLVDAARYVRSMYMDSETSASAVKTFTDKLHECINKVAKFCNPKNIKYESMLCSIYVFSSCIEDVYQKFISDRMTTKEKEYNDMPMKTIEHIYAAVDSNLPTEYIYSDKTTICIMDSVNDKSFVFKLEPDEIKKINSIHSFCRGTIMYDIYKDKHMITSQKTI
jgi:hypothetical protein